MERKITIEEEAVYKEDYQMRMLKVNHLEGILKMGGRGVNNSSFYDYDVSGKMSMKAMFERSKIGAEDIKIFLRDFKTAVKEVETFLLNIHCILLKPEYIFYEEGKYCFCYYPPAKQDIWAEFHVLTEYFVKQADYQPVNGVEADNILTNQVQIRRPESSYHKGEKICCQLQTQGGHGNRM